MLVDPNGETVKVNICIRNLASRNFEYKQSSKLMDSGSVVLSKWLCLLENMY